MSLGLAAGDTPIGLYRELVLRERKGEVRFEGVRAFSLDEYVGSGPDDEQSYRYFMQFHLFSRTSFRPEDVHCPNGRAENLDDECARYERIVEESGGIDLQILGIGRNGHVGFNDPGCGFDSATRVVELAPSTINANAKHFSNLQQVPRRAIIMNLANIMRSKCILLLANGEEKTEVLFKALKEEPSPSIPASVLQRHPRLTVFLSRGLTPRCRPVSTDDGERT